MEDWVLFNYIAGHSDSDESRRVEAWVAEDPENGKYAEKLRKIWQHADLIEELESLEPDKDWNTIRERIGFESRGDRSSKFNLFNFSVYPLLKVAAILVIIIVPAMILELKFHFIISPAVEWVSVATGSQSRDLILPDSTFVTLNSNSEIRYPERFVRMKREVRLKGEAYFDVVHDDRNPFIIYPGKDLVIRVLGTSFTISTGENTKEMVVVQVISGTVSFYQARQKGKKLILFDGEQGIHDIHGFSKSRIEDPNFLSWKTHRLEFRKTPFGDIVNSLEQYSGKKIIVRGDGFDGLHLTSSYDNQDLTDILDEISTVLGIGYTMMKDTITFHMAGE
ncbi:FecR family protein [Bacteroidota bacterium]